MSLPKYASRTLVVVFNIVISLALIELILVVLLHSPRLTAAAPAPVRRLSQQVYRHFNRLLVQFDETCARYDPEVTYTLRPGTCTFSNIEFSTTLHVNRLGLRDDDAALEGPEIVVLGDSHAMGWGVEQSEAFPAVIERASGRTVINAAVSSYATVREMRMLDRIDTSRMKVLVLQYSDNDLVENRAFSDGGNRLPITDQATYENIVGYYARQQSYFPGKYLFRLGMKITRLEAPEPDQLKMEPVAPDREVELFLNALTHAGKTPLDGVAILVLEVNQDLAHTHAFSEALARAAARPDFPLPRLKTLDSSTVLKADDFFVLDDHMTAKGHEVLGQAIAQAIRGL